MQIAESVFKEKPDKPGMAFAPYDKLPEPFKKFIKMEGGFKTSDLDNKALSELTDNKMYSYGVTYFQDSQYYSVWRREHTIQGAASSTSGGTSSTSSWSAKKWPTNLVMEIFEGSADEVNKKLSKNIETNPNDPKWKVMSTYRMSKKVTAGQADEKYVTEEDKLVYVLHLVKKVW